MSNRMVQDFVLKDKEIFVGLEDSKKTWKIAVRSDRTVIDRTAMEAKYPLLIRYLTRRFPDCTIHVIYEAGFKGFNLHDKLTDDGIDCIVIPPHMVTEPKVNRVKTDKRDASRLAVILENGDYKDACHIPDRERREDRQITRTLAALQKDIVRTRNRVHKFLDFHGVEADLKEGASKEQFRALRNLTLSESLRLSLTILLDQLDQFWAHRDILHKALRSLCTKERYRKTFTITQSIPGIGWLSAIRLILELGEDLSRFTSGKKMASFVGLTCSEYSTGETERKERITGMGSGFIRAMLVENSWIAVRKDPVLLAKFTRVWRSSGSKKKAIVAVARTLIVRFRACVIMDTPYAAGIIK